MQLCEIRFPRLLLFQEQLWIEQDFPGYAGREVFSANPSGYPW